MLRFRAAPLNFQRVCGLHVCASFLKIIFRLFNETSSHLFRGQAADVELGDNEEMNGIDPQTIAANGETSPESSKRLTFSLAMRATLNQCRKTDANARPLDQRAE